MTRSDQLREILRKDGMRLTGSYYDSSGAGENYVERWVGPGGRAMIEVIRSLEEPEDGDESEGEIGAALYMGQ